MTKLCDVLKVNRSAYYAWDKNGGSKREIRRSEIGKKVQKIFNEQKHIPGSCKITEILKQDGERIGHKYVSDIMKTFGLKSKTVKKYKATTNSKHNLPVAENLLLRERSEAERIDLHSGKKLDKYERIFNFNQINKAWVSDITYIATDEGWLYLAGIMDLCGKELVGWSMKDRMTKELVVTAFENARRKRNNPKGVILHSDRGSQYCSKMYRNLLERHGFLCSMSRKGNCWDNAPMESFWGKLKQEWLNGQHFKTREEARSAVFWYIETYYHRQRLHAGNGYCTPVVATEKNNTQTA